MEVSHLGIVNLWDDFTQGGTPTLPYGLMTLLLVVVDVAEVLIYSSLPYSSINDPSLATPINALVICIS